MPETPFGTSNPNWRALMSLELLALILALLTIAGVLGPLLYSTREARANRRAQNLGERRRRRKNAERIEAKQRQALGD